MRGLFDTDGSFHKHHKNTAIVEFTSYRNAFLLSIKKALCSIGFTAGLSGNNVYIYKSEQVEKFFEEIKPNNLKHIYKYNFFKQKGYVPTHKETIAAVV